MHNILLYVFVDIWECEICGCNSVEIWVNGYYVKYVSCRYFLYGILLCFQSIEDVLGVAGVYSEMYPIFFNIFLWGGIAFALVIFAVAYGIWVMDPGKDSIIYRMTSQRIKKD